MLLVIQEVGPLLIHKNVERCVNHLKNKVLDVKRDFEKRVEKNASGDTFSMRHQYCLENICLPTTTFPTSSVHKKQSIPDGHMFDVSHALEITILDATSGTIFSTLSWVHWDIYHIFDVRDASKNTLNIFFLIFY